MKDDVFAVIADSTRRHILQALAVERLAVGELVEELGVSQPTVSKHLKVLRTAGLVETEAVGQKRFYSITPVPLLTITDWAQTLIDAPALQTGESQTVPTPQDERAHPADQQVSTASPPSLEKKVSPLATSSEPEETEEEPPVTAEVTQEQVDTPLVPHPTNAGILITPLTAFTPVLDRYTGEQADGIIDKEQVFPRQKAESTKALSATLDNTFAAEDLETEATLQLKLMAQNLTLDSEDEQVSPGENPLVPQGLSQAQPALSKLETDIDAQAEAAVAESQERASITEAQAAEAAEEGGLLSKLARWGRRSAR
ncbi:ArsR/SmtB family transcription factor [Rothia sp. CCM 9416]|uniref:ArsR/SmtB family transcription factor n=1 Tax=Rothia sp. CCM 9416 TaxID=3402655 RepID=UPI003AE3BCCC